MLNAKTAADIMADMELTTEKSRWVHVEACSAKTGAGLEQGITKLIEASGKSK